jgi:hypothetical protein
MGAPGQGVIGQTDAALDFIEQFLGLDPLYAKANPGGADRLKRIKEQDRHYLAHEYMNRDWHPMYFSDVEKWLGDAKVGFACSAHVLDLLHELNLTPQQSEFMKGVPNGSLRETLRDFCTNQQFRRDYWVRGVRQLSVHEQASAIRQERVILTVAEKDLPTKVRGILGEANLVDTVYRPLFDLLLDHRPHSVAEIETQLAKSNIQFPQITSALTVLLGLGVLSSVVADADSDAAKTRTKALNTAIAGRSLSTGEIAHFASPVTGGGVTAPRFSQLFWLSREQGGKTADDWATFAYQTLSAQGQSIVKEGVTLQGEDNLTELKAQAKAWEDNVLPIWTALGL